jgi:hypothetical protein
LESALNFPPFHFFSPSSKLWTIRKDYGLAYFLNKFGLRRRKNMNTILKVALTGFVLFAIAGCGSDSGKSTAPSVSKDVMLSDAGSVDTKEKALSDLGWKLTTTYKETATATQKYITWDQDLLKKYTKDRPELNDTDKYKEYLTSVAAAIQDYADALDTFVKKYEKPFTLEGKTYTLNDTAKETFNTRISVLKETKQRVEKQLASENEGDDEESASSTEIAL